MEKHKWSVGALCELYPEGYVGVSDVCVMGLNENKGQRILLRLRTDDMKGFRKMLTIKKVLCHEMAHNEHGDHDSSFYVLMRQIERDVVLLDWRNSK
ncbi:WLM domain-containing protein, partial [Ochromonadaceae sp. CCMP2298]